MRAAGGWREGAQRIGAVLAGVNWWLALATAALCLVGLVFLGSATQTAPEGSAFARQHGRQTLYVVCSLGVGFLCLLPHYAVVMRAAWPLYGLAVLALAGLPFFAPEINGARRWYAMPGFSVQPSEFAKLAVVVALAALLRWKNRAKTFDGLVVPILVVCVPAVLVLRQPDLGSTLVLGPVLLATCYAAGASARSVLAVLAIAVGLFVLGWFTVLHGYQRMRAEVWAEHWTWSQSDLGTASVQDLLRGPAYQPWQSLIAMGSGGWTGFGIGEGPQNRYDFLPYRSEDYVFAVVGEETGWLGCALVLGLYAAIVAGLLVVASRTRERFGKLLCVGVAAWLGSQALIHAAVCGWLVPATGLPMPFVSYGGSSTLAAALGIALCLNVSARRDPVLAGDGFG